MFNIYVYKYISKVIHKIVLNRTFCRHILKFWIQTHKYNVMNFLEKYSMYIKGNNKTATIYYYASMERWFYNSKLFVYPLIEFVINILFWDFSF